MFRQLNNNCVCVCGIAIMKFKNWIIKTNSPNTAIAYKTINYHKMINSHRTCECRKWYENESVKMVKIPISIAYKVIVYSWQTLIQLFEKQLCDLNQTTKTSQPNELLRNKILWFRSKINNNSKRIFRDFGMKNSRYELSQRWSMMMMKFFSIFFLLLLVKNQTKNAFIRGRKKKKLKSQWLKFMAFSQQKSWMYACVFAQLDIQHRNSLYEQLKWKVWRKAK